MEEREREKRAASTQASGEQRKRLPDGRTDGRERDQKALEHTSTQAPEVRAESKEQGAGSREIARLMEELMEEREIRKHSNIRARKHPK